MCNVMQPNYRKKRITIYKLTSTLHEHKKGNGNAFNSTTWKVEVGQS